MALARRAFGPLAALCVLAPMAAASAVVDLGRESASRDGNSRVRSAAAKPLSARAAATVAAVTASDGRVVTIDRYEHPNELGALPTTGLGPAEAAAACERAGAQLCTSVDWFEACSDGGRAFYPFPSAPWDPAAWARVRRDCNVRHPDRARGLLPAGEMARCHGRPHVHDLAGNAFEWVRLGPDRGDTSGSLEGFWGLAGSWYGYSDAQTTSCGFRVMVHETQLDIIDLSAVGFRCCYRPAANSP